MEGETRANYLFTANTHVSSSYEIGQRFEFAGDDDVWVFVNGRLAWALAGVGMQRATIDFDAMAAPLEIEPSNSYALDLFVAERMPSASNFRVETHFKCIRNVVR